MSAADGDLSTTATLNDSFFTDNVLINCPGDDLAIFENTDNNLIRLYTRAGANAASTTGDLNFITARATVNTSGFSLNAAAIDLSAFGFADGAEITSGLFLARDGVFATVWDVAALNSDDVVTVFDPDVVPLPAGLPLLLGALGVLIWCAEDASKIFRKG